MRVLAALLLVACSDGAPPRKGGPACAGGDSRCLGGTFYLCTGGELHPEPACTSCNEHLGGCQSCVPGTSVCRDGWSFVCSANGAAFETWYCDSVQGVGCDIDSGRCVGACAPQNLGQSYIGCDYYPTITGNVVNSNFQFAVAIANTSYNAAQVTLEWGALDGPDVFQVPPHSVEVRRLPWVIDLKGCDDPGALWCSVQPPSAIVPKGAYHLRSTQPVTVYQFSPLDYQKGSEYSYTNDASLLFPANALGTDYVVASWNALTAVGASTNASVPGLLAITATRDGTQVTVTPRAATRPGKRIAAFAAGAPQTLILNQGDVLQVFNPDGDLTGSRVVADRPVQVISGHFCADVPVGIPYCDHLEESMFPVRALSNKYVIDPPALPAMPNGKPQVVRIVAAQDDTDLAFDPPQPGAPTRLASAGDFVELSGTRASFVLTATHRVLVAQYMEGQDAGGAAGDPAMTLAVPVDQFRRQYLFHAPTNYTSNYVEVVAPAGARVTLDGLPVGGFAPIGASNFTLARMVLGDGDAGDGNHRIESDQPFGISVYGYGQYTSYWYPGGLDLSNIVVP